MSNRADTIVAIASALGCGTRGIVRISGPAALRCLAVFWQNDAANQKLESLTRPGILRGQLLLPTLGLVPAELFIWPTHRSYTRQPLVEVHTLACTPLCESLVRACCVHGARLAEPGEFTLRAFLAGRLDLTQAEAVLGVIAAQDQEQLRSALDQMAGGLARPLVELRERSLQLLARLEAGLDFADEDIELIDRETTARELTTLWADVKALLQQFARRSAGDADPRVVLFGAPNVGKSSLFNALYGSDAAIVADRPGTTRDYVSARLLLGNARVELIDTAGAQDTELDAIEQLAQPLTHGQVRGADLVLFCLDQSRPLNDWERQMLVTPSIVPRLVVQTKGDLPAVSPGECDGLAVSARSGLGLETLRGLMADRLAARLGRAAGTTTSRCGDALMAAERRLADARELADQGAGDELLAVEIRSALFHLGEIVGQIYTDDLLDRIFSQFCIGK